MRDIDWVVLAVLVFLMIDLYRIGRLVDRVRARVDALERQARRLGTPRDGAPCGAP